MGSVLPKLAWHFVASECPSVCAVCVPSASNCARGVKRAARVPWLSAVDAFLLGSASVAPSGPNAVKPKRRRL